ncbi:MAG: O-antigen ligase family protein [Acidobacteriota bacterium]|nr:O-antigen ligase family protein [Acidobacteriota bacterium]
MAKQAKPSQAPSAAGLARQFRQPDLDNPLRKLGLYLAIAFIFCRFSLLGELVSSSLNFDPHIARILGVPTVVLAMISGGAWRVLRSKFSFAWLGLTIWMLLTVPFSYWPGGSESLILSWVKGQLPMLLIVGGLVLTWKECKLVLLSLALACFVNVMSGKLFVLNSGSDTRLSLELGTIGNANDFTAHLFFALPFVFFALISSRGWIRRILCLGVIGYGVYFCAATGSRGGLIAFASACLFILIRAPGRVRIGALAAGAAMFLIVLFALPQTLLQRYATLFTNDTNDLEAVESTAARTHLLKASIRFTAEHPIFGVGPGEFSDYEASIAKDEGRKAAWQVTHNAYTQVSSEAGLPALLFYLTAIVMTFWTFEKVYRVARARPQFRSMAMACFCCQLSLVGFCTATMFLSLAYSMYLPTMSGLALAISGALEREMAGQS